MNPRRIAASTLVGCVAFVLLWFPWPGWRVAYSRCFQGVTQAALDCLGFAAVEVRRNSEGHEGGDIALVYHEAAGRWKCSFPSDLVGWLPTAMFFSLCAASGLRRARYKPALAGALLVQVYVLGRVIILLLRALTQHAGEKVCSEAHAGFLRSQLWRATIRTLGELDSSPAVYTLVPLLIWASLVIGTGLSPRVTAGLSPPVAQARC